MFKVPTLLIRSVDSGRNFPDIQLRCKTNTGAVFTTTALLDSGANSSYVDHSFVKKYSLDLVELEHPRYVYNVDGTRNQGGTVTHTIDLIIEVQGHQERASFYVTDLGRKSMIVGMSWLRLHNPEIDWQTGKLLFTRCPPSCGAHRQFVNTIPLSSFNSIPPSLYYPAGPQTPMTDLSDLNNLDLFDKISHVYFLPDQDLEINAYEGIATRLAHESAKDQTKTTLEDIQRGPYADLVEVFSKKDFDELPQRKKWDHAIDFKEDWKPFPSRVYPLSKTEQTDLDEFLQENLNSGRIRPSKSPIASPFFFVKKKDGGLRPIQDYRKLNAITIKNRYPLPLISELVDKLKGAKWFTKLDVRWGYNNIRIKEGDEWKAAFLTNRGLFEPTVMFFGLTNSPATFQTMMDEIFRELLQEGIMLVYMDDILIYTRSDNIEDHHRAVRRVLEILAKYRLFLKPEKCQFDRIMVEFLGLIVGRDGISMDPVKVDGVRTWPIPTSVTQVRSFLGFANFYRRFIAGFSETARPLNDLTKKDFKFTWEDHQQKAFDKLKDIITSAPVLTFPDFQKPKMMECDASNFAYGAVLSQLEDDEKWHPVAFMSKSMTPAERNYDIHDKELLAIMASLEEWRHLVEGSGTFQILTDHRNLEYFTKAQKLNRRQARWSAELQRFDFTLHHRPGRLSAKPDALSRRADHDQGLDDNKDQIILPSALFVNALEIGPEILPDLRKEQTKDPVVIDLMKTLESDGIGTHWDFDGNLWTYDGRAYVPESLRHQVLKGHHDIPAAGHPGRDRTLELVSRNYYWPRMSRYVATYVGSCDLCNRTKIQRTKPFGTLKPNEVPERPWQVITFDLIVELPESQGYDAIFVVVDRFTKMIHIAPTTTEVTTIGIARLLRDMIWRYHGLPEVVISDRGSQFASQVMLELNKLLEITTSLSTAYHPQTDGQTERVNMEVEQFLRVYISERQDDWVEWLSMCEFAYNNHQHASSNQTPFFLNYGHHPRMGTELNRNTKFQSIDEFTFKMDLIRKDAAAALRRAAEDMKRYYDQGVKEAPEYKEGDRVWLEGTNIHTQRPSAKLAHKRYGPYEIVKKISSHAFKLKLPKAWKIHPVFHVSLLRPFVPDPILERHAAPPPEPDLIDGEPEYEIEKILNSRIRYRKMEYLVKWVGYPTEENTWNKAADMEHAQEEIEEFHKQNPRAPHLIRFAEIHESPSNSTIHLPGLQILGESRSLHS